MLRAVRVRVLNALATAIVRATQPWVRDAPGHPDAAPEAVGQIMARRFGDRRVAYDPSDPEANKLAVVAGYTVMTGGALSAGE